MTVSISRNAMYTDRHPMAATVRTRASRSDRRPTERMAPVWSHLQDDEVRFLAAPLMTAGVALSALPPLTTPAVSHDADYRVLLSRRPPFLSRLIEAGKVFASFTERTFERGGEMRLSDVTELAEDIAMEYGYDIPKVEVKRLKAWHAICRVYSNTIVLDSRIVEANSVEDMTKIIKHELAHFKSKYHGIEFRDELIRMGLEVHQRSDRCWYEVGEYVDPRPRYRRN